MKFLVKHWKLIFYEIYDFLAVTFEPKMLESQWKTEKTRIIA